MLSLVIKYKINKFNPCTSKIFKGVLLYDETEIFN